MARNAAVTDATAMIERYSHDVSTGEAYARGVAESESAQVQALESHYDRMAETSGLTKDQVASLAAEARIGGGWSKVVKIGAEGSASWRGQTIGSEAFNRMKEYAERQQVLDLSSRVAEASRRYATQTGDSRHAGLEESLAANLTDLKRFEERAALSRQESESWAEQAARVRSEAQAIDRELGQPFFAWLGEREDAGGRPLGAAGAIRLASPQTPEEAETLRQYAAEFVAERFPEPAGPDPASVPGRAEYEAARDALGEAYARDIGATYAGGVEDARGRAQTTGAPAPGEVEAGAGQGRAEVEAGIAAAEAAREERQRGDGARIGAGRDEIGAELDKPFRRHATENVPLIGGWLAGKLFGTAENTTPVDGDAARGVEVAPGEAGPPGVRDGEDAPRHAESLRTAPDLRNAG